MNTPKKHHYAPQFFLRNFAIDPERKKVTALNKHGQKAVWAKKSIKSIAYEHELYIHMEGSAPVSVEEKINSNLENPISKSETWRKIAAGAVDDLDPSDRAVLYSLVRNLEVRTPHYRNMLRELSILADRADSDMTFSDTEKKMYAEFREKPNRIPEVLNQLASSRAWTRRDFYSCAISIWRVSNPTYVCSTPVHVMKVPDSPLLRATQAGQAAFSYLMPLTPNSYVFVTLGDFDGAFENVRVHPNIEKSLKRQIVGQFSYFPIVRHLICPGDGLNEQMTWAGYTCENDTPSKKSFRRDSTFRQHQSPE